MICFQPGGVARDRESRGDHALALGAVVRGLLFSLSLIEIN